MTVVYSWLLVLTSRAIQLRAKSYITTLFYLIFTFVSNTTRLVLLPFR